LTEHPYPYLYPYPYRSLSLPEIMLATLRPERRQRDIWTDPARCVPSQGEGSREVGELLAKHVEKLGGSTAQPP
jgi:hypothetical protein